MIVKPKRKRILSKKGRLYGKTKQWKKAIVTLAPDQKNRFDLRGALILK
jgi:ribosomal protein L23